MRLKTKNQHITLIFHIIPFYYHLLLVLTVYIIILVHLVLDHLYLLRKGWIKLIIIIVLFRSPFTFTLEIIFSICFGFIHPFKTLKKELISSLSKLKLEPKSSHFRFFQLIYIVSGGKKVAFIPSSLNSLRINTIGSFILYKG